MKLAETFLEDYYPHLTHARSQTDPPPWRACMRKPFFYGKRLQGSVTSHTGQTCDQNLDLVVPEYNVNQDNSTNVYSNVRDCLASLRTAISVMVPEHNANLFAFERALERGVKVS